MQIVVMLPDTVDPHMVDQLQAAIQRMGGQVQPLPDENPQDLAQEPGGEPAGEAALGGPGGAPAPGDMALSPHGQPMAIPPGMMQAPPMGGGGPSNIVRPPQLRQPMPIPGRR
jgi:hypothetical protein